MKRVVLALSIIGSFAAAAPIPENQAAGFVKMALAGINREFPNKPGDVLRGPDDLRSPRATHPVFYGHFDWHSSVHGHWMLVRLLRLHPQAPFAGEVRRVLNQRFTAEALAAEAAYSAGPFTLQGEYAITRLDNTHQVSGINRDSTVQAFYAQASWFVTGENAVYRKDRGAFGKPQPNGKWGAVELAGRYDLAENFSQSLSANPCRSGTSKCQVEVITLGVNWYPYPNTRFMFNYYLTEAMRANAGLGTAARTDHLSVFSFRTQISF